MFTHRLMPSVLAIVTLVAMVFPAMAQQGGGSDAAQGNSTIPTDLYVSPNNNGLAIPSGDVNIVPGIATTTAVSKDLATVPADTSNMLGCGGVGQGEFTTGIYNMPESFGKFQQDADSLLSKQLLTMNFALPQTAALFDQLNNYGNQRYQTFQQGCNVSALQKDAKQQYLNACVAKILPARLQSLKQVLTSQNPQPSADAYNAMAYAQASEICANQYISDTTIVALRKDTTQAFAKQVRGVENVTNALQSLLCTSTNTGGTGTANNGCWQTLLIPQVRVCLDDSLGCDDSKGYSINEPLLTMPRLFDTLRFIMDDLIVSRRVTDLSQQITKNNIDASTQKLAASEAVMLLSNATLGRVGETGGTTTGSTPATGTPGNHAQIFFGYGVNTNPEPSIADFQLNYLNCKDADIMSPLKQYVQKLNSRIQAAGGTTGTTLTLNQQNLQEYDRVIDHLGLTDADDGQKEALKFLASVSLACTANQAVPVFDPNLTASLQTQCLPQDRYAFYSMAGYDVSLAATRDIYRYLNLQLKRTYTRLLTQSTVPSVTTAGTTGSTGTADQISPTISPELNARLARVVKEVMIPQVESQIERLDELNKTRGQFAQRVQQIYTAKTGCVYAKGWFDK